MKSLLEISGIQPIEIAALLVADTPEFTEVYDCTFGMRGDGCLYQNTRYHGDPRGKIAYGFGYRDVQQFYNDADQLLVKGDGPICILWMLLNKMHYNGHSINQIAATLIMCDTWEQSIAMLRKLWAGEIDIDG